MTPGKLPGKGPSDAFAQDIFPRMAVSRGPDRPALVVAFRRQAAAFESSGAHIGAGTVIPRWWRFHEFPQRKVQAGGIGQSALRSGARLSSARRSVVAFGPSWTASRRFEAVCDVEGARFPGWRRLIACVGADRFGFRTSRTTRAGS